MLKILNEGSELIRRINSNSDLVEIICLLIYNTIYNIYRKNKIFQFSSTSNI